MMKQHLRDLLGGVGRIGFPQRNGINQVHMPQNGKGAEMTIKVLTAKCYFAFAAAPAKS
jgi:hypothetical protein